MYGRELFASVSSLVSSVATTTCRSVPHQVTGVTCQSIHANHRLVPPLLYQSPQTARAPLHTRVEANLQDNVPRFDLVTSRLISSVAITVRRNVTHQVTSASVQPIHTTHQLFPALIYPVPQTPRARVHTRLNGEFEKLSSLLYLITFRLISSRLSP